MIFANTTCKGPSKKGPKGFDVFRLLRKHAVLMHRHIPTAILLLLMIVLFVAMDETFLPQLLTALAVDVGEPRAALRQGSVFRSGRSVKSSVEEDTPRDMLSCLTQAMRHILQTLRALLRLRSK